MDKPRSKTNVVHILPDAHRSMPRADRLSARWPIGLLLILSFTCNASEASGQPAPSKQRYTIGAWQSTAPDHMLNRWKPVLETYLTEQVGPLYNPPIDFELVPLDFDHSNEAAFLLDAGKLDFALHSAGGTSCLEAQFGFSPIATEVQSVEGREETCYGSIIYSLRSNNAIKNMSDFPGKRIGVGYPLEPGGFQLGAQIVFYMNDFEGLMDAVLQGHVDIGITASGWIENNFPENIPKLLYHNVMHPSYHSVRYDIPITTDLVPNFALSAAPQTPLLLQEQVATALGRLNASHPAAMSAGIARFSLPASYEVARTVLEKLGILHYTQDGKECLNAFDSLADVVQCPTGYSIEKDEALAHNCKAYSLPCPDGRTCYCRPCHPDVMVNIFPWQVVMGLCCALFAIGLCFSLGWTSFLQTAALAQDIVRIPKRSSSPGGGRGAHESQAVRGHLLSAVGSFQDDV